MGKNKHDSVKTNLIYQISYQILTIIIPLVTTPYISRILGQDGVGIYSYTSSTMYFFLLAANLGIISYGNREIAAVDDDRYKLGRTFWGIFWCHFLSTLMCLVAYVVFFLCFVTEYKLAFLCQMVYLVACLADITWFFSGLQRFKVTVLRNLLVRLITFVLVFFVVKEEADVWKYILLLAMGNLIGYLAIWTQVKAYVGVVRVPLKEVVGHFKPLLVLFIPIMAMSVYKYMDKLMIPQITKISQLGLYENAEKVMTLPLGVLTGVGSVMLPKMSKMFAEGKSDDASEYFSVALKYIMILAFGMTFGLMGVAPTLAPVFLGEEFTACGELITLISVVILFQAWSFSICTQYLIPNKKDKVFIFGTITGVIVNFILNYVLIRRYEAQGAVIATIVTELLIAVIYSVCTWKALPLKKTLFSSLIYAIPALPMYVITRFIGARMGQSIVSLIVLIMCGGSIYLLGVVLCLFISKDSMLMNFLKKLKK